MTYAVRYFSKSGNTKKVAEAIAKELGVEAKDITAPLNEPVDILFLGSAVYAAGIAEDVKAYIAQNKSKIGKIANFSTAALLKSTYKQVKKVADANGVSMLDKEFACRGAFAVMHKNRPDENDLKEAAAFARSVVS